MRILFTNDDGFDSIGLHAVVERFKSKHDIAVVAPDCQKSGYSHSVTLYPNSLGYREVVGYGYPVYAVSGTPVDCVKLGVTRFLPSPDIIISGINRGRNLGMDILYSGTVSAALDGASLGYKSIALSLCTDDANDIGFELCSQFLFDNFDKLANMELPRGTCLNINYPSGNAKGVRYAKMSALDTFKDVYDHSGDGCSPCGHRDYNGLDSDTDEALCRDGYITITPLCIDRTNYVVLEGIKKEKLVL